jgi:hypothetical protein
MTDRLQEHETWQCEISRLGVHLLVHLILVHGFISSLIKNETRFHVPQNWLPINLWVTKN